MAHLLADHRERVVLAEKLRRRIVGEFRDRVHLHQAAQPAGAVELTRKIEQVEADPRDVVGDGGLECEGVFGRHHGVGPDDELIEEIRVRRIELLRHGGQSRLARSANRSPIAPALP